MQDRRDFLASAGLLGTGALSATIANVRAAEPARANDALHVAMIGVGGRGSFLMNQVFGHQAARITAVCDVNEQHLARAADAVASRQGKKPATVRDFRRVLDDKSIDAVFVATPHHWHAPIAMRALDSGKHVYCEKPASHVFREGRRLIEAAQHSKRVFQHGTQMRSSEVTAEAGKVLASGLLGEIKMAKAWGVEPRRDHPAAVADSSPPAELDFDMWLGPAPVRPFNATRFRRWNSFREYGNGEIGGDGIHDIDMARWGLGVSTHPVRITAQGSRVHLKGESDFPDNMLVTYQYADNKVLIYENRNFAPYKLHGWDNGNLFYGTQGYMIFSRRGYFQTYLGAKEEEGPGIKGSDGVTAHVHGFLDSVTSGKTNSAGADMAHLSCALTHLGEIAYRTSRVLQFDPATESFVNDQEASALLTKSYRDPWTLVS